MVEPAESSLESMSSDQLKQLLVEQTSVLEAEPVKVEAKETELVVEPKPKPTIETTPKEEPVIEPVVEEPETKVRKIKVEGKEIDIPVDKELEYIQKGYHYEKKMAELKREKEELSKLMATDRTPATPQPQYTPEQIKDELIRRLNDDPAGTLFSMMGSVVQAEREQSKSERKADLSFEIDKNESVPHWNAVKPRYQVLRDLGESRETAFLKAENDHFKSLYVNAHKRGVEEGSMKADLKLKADMPGGEKKSSSKFVVTEPSLSDLHKMSSVELAKLLPTSPDTD